VPEYAKSGDTVLSENVMGQSETKEVAAYDEPVTIVCFAPAGVAGTY